MAAPLGFKTFATGDVLTAADANGYLMQGVWVFADATARTAAVTSPQEGNFSYLKSDDSTYYYNGSAWAKVGSSKIVQVVSATYNTPTSTTSTTYVNTGLSATITPTSASNTILVMISQNGLQRDGSSANQCIGLRLVRGSTEIVQIGTNIDYTGTALGHYFGGTTSINYVDSPATTSATTYKTTFNQNAGSGTVTTQINSSVSTIVLMEIAA